MFFLQTALGHLLPTGAQVRFTKPSILGHDPESQPMAMDSCFVQVEPGGFDLQTGPPTKLANAKPRINHQDSKERSRASENLWVWGILG